MTVDDPIVNYKAWIEEAFQRAEQGLSKITPEILQMDGLSGAMTRHFYNNLLNHPNMRYLEIGTWKGSSVCSAMCGNTARVLCIDNWSEFGGPRDEFLHNFSRYKGENDAAFLEVDCFQVDVAGLLRGYPSPFNVYMYDGNHEEHSHYRALTHWLDALDEVFIYIVDDWNWKKVREGSQRAIADLQLEILYEHSIRLTSDDSHTERSLADQTWWNGIYVAILRKPHPPNNE